MEEELKVGSVLKLKIGGPNMVVYTPPREYYAIPLVDVMWFDILDHLHRDTIKTNLLLRVS